MTREVFERGNAAAVLPYDPVLDAVVMIEQFRVGALAAGRSPWLIEIVAGIVEEGGHVLGREPLAERCHRLVGREAGPVRRNFEKDAVRFAEVDGQHLGMGIGKVQQADIAEFRHVIQSTSRPLCSERYSRQHTGGTGDTHQLNELTT